MSHDNNCPICKSKKEIEDRDYFKSPEYRVEELEKQMNNIKKRIESIENTLKCNP